MSDIPGIKAVHAIITPTCRKNRTPYGALLEAYERVEKEYVACNLIPDNADVSYHLVLTVERKSPAQPSEGGGK
jgi:hypothetical protein